VHVVSQRARVLRLRKTEQSTRNLTWLLCCLPPLGTESASCSIGFSKLNSPAHRYLCLRFKRHLAMSPARLEARMDSLLSFPVGLFHPLQHAGLSRRSPGSRRHTDERQDPGRHYDADLGRSAQPSLASPERTPAFSTMERMEVTLRPVAKVFNAASTRPSPRRSIASPSETAKCSMTLESR
jgi:hypothetical protein